MNDHNPPTRDRQSAPATLRTLHRGFQTPVFEAQSVFRAVLTALSEPGFPRRIDVDVSAPEGLHPATAAILLALADFETPVWLPPELARGEAGAWVRFHCGSVLVEDSQRAVFAVVDGSTRAPRLDQFCVGSDQFPDRSTTVLLQCVAFDAGEPMVLSGPGIETRRGLAVDGLRAAFRDEWAANAKLYPVGVDVLLVADATIVGFPRTTLIEEQV
jgi:alpha-D-ribose 1-methylphosphonate 5-triphosphate synthase subunit PhnH